MHPSSFFALVLASCAVTTAPPAPANTTASADAPGLPNDTWCSRPARDTKPLSLDEIEPASAADDAKAARDLIGVWDGHLYDVDGELGQPGFTAAATTAESLCFARDGRLLVPTEEPHARRGCSPRSRTYSLEREPEANNALLLSVRSEGGCPGDASYGHAYTSVFELHRVDDHLLVLLDGSTGAIKGYRRR